MPDLEEYYAVETRNYSQFCMTVASYLGTYPLELQEKRPAGDELETAHLLRRGVGLSIFNRLELHTSNCVTSFCHYVNGLNIPRSAVGEGLWNKIQQRIFEVSDFAADNEDIAQRNSGLGRLATEAYENQVVRLSSRSFFTKSNINWGNLTEELNFLKKIVCAHRSDENVLKPSGLPAFGDIVKKMCDSNTHESITLGMNVPGEKGYGNEPGKRLWHLVESCRHSAAHDAQAAPGHQLLVDRCHQANLLGVGLTRYLTALFRVAEGQVGAFEDQNVDNLIPRLAYRIGETGSLTLTVGN